MLAAGYIINGVTMSHDTYQFLLVMLFFVALCSCSRHLNINYVLLSLILLRVQQVSLLQKHQWFSAGAGRKSLLKCLHL